MKTIKEEWKDVVGYEGLYGISNLGNVRSIARNTTRGKQLKPTLQSGYLKVMLSKNNNKKWHSIHRLVATAFIDNKENKKQVNHIDGNKTNNNVNNLEWCTCRENIIHSIKNKLKITKTSGEHKLSKKINQYDLYGNLIKQWHCINDIYRELGISKGNVSSCCNKKRKTVNGYVWRYVDE